MWNEEIYLDWFVTANQQSFRGCLQKMSDNGIMLILVQGQTGREHSDVVQRQDDVLLLEHFKLWKKTEFVPFNFYSFNFYSIHYILKIYFSLELGEAENLITLLSTNRLRATATSQQRKF